LQPFLNVKVANIIFTEIVSLKETAFSSECFSHAHFRSSSTDCCSWNEI